MKTFYSAETNCKGKGGYLATDKKWEKLTEVAAPYGPCNYYSHL